MSSGDLPVPSYANATARQIAAPGIPYGPDDFYHRNVQLAAAKLCRLGEGRLVYGGQWSSGKTWWRKPEGGTLAVERQETKS